MMHAYAVTLMQTDNVECEHEDLNKKAIVRLFGLEPQRARVSIRIDLRTRQQQ